MRYIKANPYMVVAVYSCISFWAPFPLVLILKSLLNWGVWKNLKYKYSDHYNSYRLEYEEHVSCHEYKKYRQPCPETKTNRKGCMCDDDITDNHSHTPLDYLCHISTFWYECCVICYSILSVAELYGECISMTRLPNSSWITSQSLYANVIHTTYIMNSYTTCIIYQLNTHTYTYIHDEAIPINHPHMHSELIYTCNFHTDNMHTLLHNTCTLWKTSIPLKSWYCIVYLCQISLILRCLLCAWNGVYKLPRKILYRFEFLRLWICEHVW